MKLKGLITVGVGVEEVGGGGQGRGMGERGGEGGVGPTCDWTPAM